MRGPILEKGEKAYDDVKAHVVSKEVDDVIKSIIIATGSVSLSVNPDYNSALAHALYYGLTAEKVFLHDSSRRKRETNIIEFIIL